MKSKAIGVLPAFIFLSSRLLIGGSPPPNDGLAAIMEGGSNTPVAASFITTLNGTAVAPCPSKIFSADTKLVDRTGKEIEYTAVLVPEDPALRRSFIFLETPKALPGLELAPADSEKPSAETRVWTPFLAKSALKRMKAKGKVKFSKNGTLILDIKTKVKSNFTGAPLISSDSGKVVGAVICSKTPQGYYAAKAMILDDSIKCAKTPKERMDKELAIAKELDDAIKQYGAAFLQARNLVKEYGFDKVNAKKLNRFAKMDDKRKRELAKKVETLLKTLKTNRENIVESVKKSAAFGKLTIPAMEMSRIKNIARGREIHDRKSLPVEENLKKILDKLQ